MPAMRQVNSSSVGSFDDVLATVQASSLQSQNGTSGGTNSTQQFQPEPLWRAISFSDQQSGSSSERNQLHDSKSDNSSTPNLAKNPAGKAGDVHVSNPSNGPAQTPPRKESAGQQNSDSSGQSVDAKPTEKGKHRKDASHTGEQVSAGDSSEIANVTNDASAPTTTSMHDEPLVSGSENLVAQTGDNTSTGQATIKKPKASESGADLAFALKVQGDTAPPKSDCTPTDRALSVENLSGQASSSQVVALSTALTSEGGQKALRGSASSREDSVTGLTLVPNSTAQNSSAPLLDSAAKAAPESVSKLQELPEDPTANGQPLKAVQVQITGVDNQRVDLKLMEKAGSLTLSVRSADGSLTKALQQQLPELASSLNNQQIRAEWWKPELQKSELSQGSHNSSESNKGSNSTTQDQGNQGRGNLGQQGERRARQTDWVEELSDLRKSTQNGTQFSWHL